LDARIFEKAEGILMAEEVWCILVELPKIPSVVLMQGSSRRRKAFRWLKRLRCRLVELPKIPSVVGCKNLQKAEGIPMVEEVKVETCGTTWCSGKQGKKKQGG
jgi:hypothetical protein